MISGTWWAGKGATFDPNNTTPLGPGSYMLHPAGEVHFDGAKDVEAIVEIKGMGPAPSIPFTAAYAARRNFPTPRSTRCCGAPASAPTTHASSN